MTKISFINRPINLDPSQTAPGLSFRLVIGNSDPPLDPEAKACSMMNP